MGKWPLGSVATVEEAARLDHGAEETNHAPTTLVPLSLDTILTAGDVKRILKIISSV